MPCLTTLRHSSPDRGLTEALTARPLIEELTWNDPPGTVDLSATHLLTLTDNGSDGRSWRVYADPAAHPFCLIRH